MCSIGNSNTVDTSAVTKTSHNAMEDDVIDVAEAMLSFPKPVSSSKLGSTSTSTNNADETKVDKKAAYSIMALSDCENTKVSCPNLKNSPTKALVVSSSRTKS